jgi:LuxR family maltose regulon positive regulatory protein
MAVILHAPQLLVPTKLTAPQPLALWVQRGRLLTQLEAEPRTRLILVVAPAGFGKSTLIAQWLLRAQHEAGERYAWLTLDEHDQDVPRFLAYLVGAIRQAVPEALEPTLALLAAADSPRYAIIQSLLIDLDRLPEGLTLVLDDYHTLMSEPIHQTVAYLLRHLPPRCRLVLLSRADPPLPLARLHAERQVLELRTADLRFTPAETDTLLAAVLGFPPRAALVAALHQHTEGWAIALQMAALAQTEIAPQDQHLGMATQQIAEFLSAEVLARQPAALQQALLALAIPERFCAELCAALLDTPLAQAESYVEQLVRANLFLLPLDGERRWFRFHHLFRSLLLRRLRLTVEGGQVRELHLRAARWFADQALVEEALRHFLTAGDEAAAGDLVERQMLPGIGQGEQDGRPNHWLRLLPDSLVARRPGLALIKAHLAGLSLNLPALEADLARVDALLAACDADGGALPWATFRADLAALRGHLLYWHGRPAEAIDYLRQALEQGTIQVFASQSFIYLGLAYVADGRYAEGVRLVEEELPEGYGRLGDGLKVYQYACLCGMHLLAGELEALARDAQRLAEAVPALDTGDQWMGYAAYSQAIAAYERSDLSAAAEHFGAVVRLKYQVSFPVYSSAVIGLTMIAAARGAFAEATASAQELRAFAIEAGGAFLYHQAQGCALRLALLRNDVTTALRAALSVAPDIHLGISIWLETPQLSQARALIAADDPASFAQAEAILARCLDQAESLHHTRLRIATLATLALLRQAQGQHDEALATLARAVELAVPRGFVRTFVDLGPSLKPLLRALADQGVVANYLKRVLAAYTPLAVPQERAATPALRLRPPQMLTRREAEILALLAERWSDKEIAERLVIAPNTVRKHTSTIYNKLGVGNRREAVAVAKALGLLPPA